LNEISQELNAITDFMTADVETAEQEQLVNVAEAILIGSRTIARSIDGLADAVRKNVIG
jgi:hypothetical protein